jgi:hypothetical protein
MSPLGYQLYLWIIPVHVPEVSAGLSNGRFYLVDVTCAFQAAISIPLKGILTKD